MTALTKSCAMCAAALPEYQPRTDAPLCLSCDRNCLADALAVVTRERDEQKDALDDALDDVFGLQPVNATFGEALLALEQNVAERSREYERVRAERDRMRNLALEAWDIANEMAEHATGDAIDAKRAAVTDLTRIRTEIDK